MNSVNKRNPNAKSQHRGFGKKIMKKMEEIALENNYTKICVISGVGARKYYENKHNYTLGDYDYMYKNLNDYDLDTIII